MTDNSEKLRELFGEQNRLRDLRERTEYYQDLTSRSRQEWAELLRDNQNVAEAQRPEYEKAIADYDRLAMESEKAAQQLDSSLMAEWKENAHLMGGLTKEQAAELAAFEAERQQKAEADRIRSEQEAERLKAAQAASERTAKLQELMREGEEARQRRQQEKDRGPDR